MADRSGRNGDLTTGEVMRIAAGAVAVLAAGILVGASFTPGDWYAGLNKPWFTPAPWVFGPVWAVLYLLIGWAGVRSLRSGAGRGPWVAQMVLNLSWSPVFFGLQMPAAGLGVIVAMWIAIVAFIAATWQRDRTAALLFLPYLAWVTLATAVNAGVVWLNPTT